MSRSAMIAALSALLLATPVAAEQVMRVEQGPLSGVKDNDVRIYYGVPFAAPPTGADRWAPPRPPHPWDETVRRADVMPPSCPQELSAEGFMMWTSEYMTPVEPGVSEDCLFANIWTAAETPGAALPVLVYIHGGGYTSGSGTVPVYDGANLARQGLVVVTINYRLGVLGFLAHPELTAEQRGASGNYALQDQIEALRWIRQNISAFGGDPAKVTIAGQSAGGGSVLGLLASPEAKGLFRAAIVQSAPGMGSYPPPSAAEQSGSALVKSWNVQSIADARALPVEKLTVSPGPGGGGLPIADGKVIPTASQSLGMANDVPVMTGYTLNDLFAPTRRVTATEWNTEARERYGSQAEKFLRFYPGDSDAQASDSATREITARAEMAPILEWMEHRGAQSPVYAYLFSHVEPGPNAAQYGAFHSSELPYMFDTLHLSPGRDFTEVDRNVVRQFSGAVVNFVTTGNPGGGTVPTWPALDAEGKAVMEFNATAKLSRIYPEGADGVIAAGSPPALPNPFAAPATP